MSRASLAVLFPDGTVKAGIYEGTSDIVVPWLWDDIDQAWEKGYPRGGRQTRKWDERPVGEVYDVVIYSDYGRGRWWEGRATKELVVDGLDPYCQATGGDDWLETTPGRPEWVDASGILISTDRNE